MQYDFDILLLARQVSDKFFESDRLSALENETGFRFFREEKEKYIFFIFEPNNNEPYRSIDIRDFIKENTNASNAKDNPRELEKITDSLIERSRGIIQERIARSETETARSEEIGARDRQLHQFYDSQIYKNLSVEEINKLWKLRNETLEQSKQVMGAGGNILKAYKQTLTPNPKDLETEIVSSLSKEDSPKNQENQNNSNIFSKFKNKLNNISQNLSNPTSNASEIDKTQDKQESDSILNTHLRRNRK